MHCILEKILGNCVLLQSTSNIYIYIYMIVFPWKEHNHSIIKIANLQSAGLYLGFLNIYTIHRTNLYNGLHMAGGGINWCKCDLSRCVGRKFFKCQPVCCISHAGTLTALLSVCVRSALTRADQSHLFSPKALYNTETGSHSFTLLPKRFSYETVTKGGDKVHYKY